MSNAAPNSNQSHFSAQAACAGLLSVILLFVYVTSQTQTLPNQSSSLVNLVNTPPEPKGQILTKPGQDEDGASPHSAARGGGGPVPAAVDSRGCNFSATSTPIDSSGDATNAAEQEQLFQAWNRIYNLNNSRNPPSASDIFSAARPARHRPWPLAPHLENCDLLTRMRKELESWGEWPPAWAQDEGNPQPPWIRGSDASNLPLTRQVQAFLWRRQFPPNCSHPSHRFLVHRIERNDGYGLGSKLHILSGVFAMAVEHGRILVPVRGSFRLADHDGCEGEDRASLDCYFFPATSQECYARVQQLWKQHAPAILYDKQKNSDRMLSTLGSSTPLVEATVWALFNTKEGWGFAPSIWGRPWERAVPTQNVLGTWTAGPSPNASWWRAQSMRFLLRWPTPYLCHLSNRARHSIYGSAVAAHVARNNVIFRATKSGDGLNRSQEQNATQVDAWLKKHPFMEVVFDSEEKKGHEMPHFTEAVLEEPYVPRPILSIHVRQGDKGKEMKLFSFSAHMAAADWLRLHREPDLAHVWLSTEMKAVVEEAISGKYRGWTFLYSRNRRQKEGLSMALYSKLVGPEEMTSLSFVNLMISSQCDHFIGTLGSNWNRLINELRLTGGRLNAGYYALNIGEY